MLFNQITNFSISPSLAQCAIEVCVAGGVRIARNLQHVAFGIEGLRRDRIELGLTVGG